MHYFIYGVLPYLAITIMILGSIIRYDRDPFTWKSKSSQLLRRRSFIWGSVLFHVGVLVIFLGHLGGLLTPIVIFDTLGISHTAKQLMAVIVGGVAGVMALIGGCTDTNEINYLLSKFRFGLGILPYENQSRL